MFPCGVFYLRTKDYRNSVFPWMCDQPLCRNIGGDNGHPIMACHDVRVFCQLTMKTTAFTAIIAIVTKGELRLH